MEWSVASGSTLRTTAGRWRQFTDGSTNRQILSAAVLVASLTLAAAIATLAKDLVVASTFGTSDALDAFLIALLLPTFIVNVVAGSFSAAVIPTYVQIRDRDGQDAAQRLASGVLTLSICLLLAVAALLSLTGPLLLPVLGSGFDHDKMRLTNELFYVLLPLTVFNGFATIWSSVLNAGERFALVAFVPIAVPLAVVGALFATGRVWGIYSLAVGTLVGHILQSFVLGWMLRKCGLEIRPRWYGFEPAVRQVVSQYTPMVAGALLSSSMLLVDQAFAATLGGGSVAALSYGNKVVSLATGVGTMALGTAILPYFSRLVAANDWAGVRHTLRTYAALTLAVSIPPTLIVFFLTGSIVRLLFQRGEFTAADTEVVARVQAMYLLQIPFYTVGILLVRLISALRANKVLLWAAAVNLPLNIVLDYALTRAMGVSGIALATTLIYAATMCFFAVQLHRLLPHPQVQRTSA